MRVHRGEERDVRASSGTSIRQAAVDNDVEGIVAECGGTCSCATCHCYIDDAWIEKLEPPGDLERDMLECAKFDLPRPRTTMLEFPYAV